MIINITYDGGVQNYMRYSRQRNLVLDIVKSNPVHPTAEWVHEKAREQLPQIGIATVYRNLNALAEHGDIRKIKNIGGVDRFDGNSAEHYHLKCVCCGCLKDLEAQSPEMLETLETIIRNTFKIDAEEISISTTLMEGVCEDCRKNI